MKRNLKYELLELMRMDVKFSHACSMLHVHRSTVWRWRKQDKIFNERFREVSVVVKMLTFTRSLRAMQESFKGGRCRVNAS